MGLPLKEGRSRRNAPLTPMIRKSNSEAFLAHADPQLLQITKCLLLLLLLAKELMTELLLFANRMNLTTISSDDSLYVIILHTRGPLTRRQINSAQVDSAKGKETQRELLVTTVFCPLKPFITEIYSEELVNLPQRLSDSWTGDPTITFLRHSDITYGLERERHLTLTCH